MQESPLLPHTHTHTQQNDSEVNRSILYPNIPPRKDPDALTFLSASAISCMASFSLPELSMASWVCRWAGSDARRTRGPMFRSGRRGEESRGERRRERERGGEEGDVSAGADAEGRLLRFFYGERGRSFAERCCHLVERREAADTKWTLIS